MADDTTIIEGPVKYRDGKKWKSRWCVLRKLSPVADCVHVQLYRSAPGGGGAGGAGCAAALSLQQYVGLESGFTLDKQCHTLALVCADGVVVLALESRERLLTWAARVGAALGPARAHAVRAAAGPARLLLAPARAALVAAAPPRLLAVWDLRHLRRYGVVEGRFCLEGGSQCGKGEGLHAFVTERAEDIARDFDLACAGRLASRARPADLATPEGAVGPGALRTFGADTRLAELTTWAGPASPGDGGLPRCVSCTSALGASSPAEPPTPGSVHSAGAAPFRPAPAWTMHASSARVGPYLDYDVPRAPPAREVEDYYDTPKRLRERVGAESSAMSRSATTGSMAARGWPGAARACPCARVTDWAHSWLRLPRCGRDEEDVRRDRDALYATVDLSRKTRRRSHPVEPRPERAVAVVGAAPPDYENLTFALSLENYENARDVLRRAGVTPDELHAIGARLTPARERRAACGLPGDAGGDYLTMRPKAPDVGRPPPVGYAPMSPVTGFALERPARRPSDRSLDEKCSSDPTLCAPEDASVERRKRSSSADSSRFLDDVKEFDDRDSSTETLRDATLGARAGTPCDCAADHNKHSDADSSEASRRTRGAGAAPAAGNRDSSSSNDSGVSSCSARRGRFELPPTTSAARRHYRSARRAASAPRSPAPRRSRSSDAAPAPRAPPRHKCSSAEAEVPLLPARAVPDAHSTSSGTSDMSDYIETLSICSSHSSSDTPVTMRVSRPAASTLRPRSGREYAPRRACTLPSPH